MRDGRNVRTLAALAALTAAAVAAVAGSAGPAEAAQRRAPRRQRIELVRPVRAPDDDAAGRAVVTHGRRGDRLSVRLRNLDPGTTYDVLDPATGAELGSVVADRKGRARLRTRVTDAGAGKAAAARVDGVCVVEDGKDPIVLVGGTDETGRGTGPDDAAFGEGFYGSLSGAGLSVSLFADGGGQDAFWAGLDVTTADGHQYLQFYADTIGGDALPLGADGVDDLAGRAFDVVDGAGAEVVSGDLPELQPLRKLMDGDVVIALPEIGSAADDTVHEAPFTLRIAADDGTLTDVGTFTPLDLGLPDDVRAGIDVFGSWDGANGSLTVYADDTGSCLSVGLFVPDGDRGSFHAYDASRIGGKGDLPLGVESIDELSGRAYELRDADGSAFVQGTVPDLESVTNVWTCDTGGDPIDPGAAPYTLWIADEGGTLVKAGELQAFDGGGGDPPGLPDFRVASLFAGSFDGDFVSLNLVSGEGFEEMDVAVWIGDGNRAGALYSWFAGESIGADPLPFGVKSVEDLVGRRVEVRNGDGDAILSDDLPELSGTFDDPTTGSGGSFDAGPAPYSLWMEDDGGVLRKIAVLTEDILYDPLGAKR